MQIKIALLLLLRHHDHNRTCIMDMFEKERKEWKRIFDLGHRQRVEKQFLVH